MKREAARANLPRANNYSVSVRVVKISLSNNGILLYNPEGIF